jgi:23S rRNA (uridine2552-2'-O)-methyltransferase
MSRYQRKDRYHQQAKREGFRSRAAYKLEQLQRAQKVLRRGQRVVDLGCWPGGWLQVAAGLVGPSGRVVGVDLAAIDPPLKLANVVAIQGDLSDPEVLAAVKQALAAERAELLLSDAAPKLTGVRDTDRAREEALLESIEALIPELLAPGGALVLKLLEGPEAQQIEKRIRTRFESAKRTRPEASRKGTSEQYLVAKGYRGAG